MVEEYKNEETLREMYHGNGMTQAEMAEELDCPLQTMRYWFDKYDIETRPSGWYMRRKPAHHTFDETTGYEKWRTVVCGERETVMVHHLILVAKGEDPHKVFSDGFDAHHKNKMRSDNRPDNLKIMKRCEHARMHANERWS